MNGAGTMTLPKRSECKHESRTVSSIVSRGPSGASSMFCEQVVGLGPSPRTQQKDGESQRGPRSHRDQRSSSANSPLGSTGLVR